jgi:ABC-type nitrate/sulfonate/bicarbonate transport system permease component
VGISLALLLWEGFSRIGGVVIPAPVETTRHIADNLFDSLYLAQRGMSTGNGYAGHVAFTARTVLVGVVLGAVSGITLGLNSLRIPMIGEIVNPLTAAFGAAPIFVAAPFFLIWFGIQPAAQIAMVAFYTTLLLYTFSRRAGQNIGAHYVESALMLGGEPRSIFRWIYLPGTVPEITGGFRISLAGAWGLAAIAELLGAQQGAGFLIKFFATAFRIDGMIAIVILLGVVAVFFDYVVVAIGRYLTRWSEAGRRLGL